MLEATRLLEVEHRMIERAYPVLERVGSIPGGDEEVVEFFREFVDAAHHHKEEVVLFPALEARGVSRTEGLVHELLVEHGHGRRMIREIGGLLHPAQEDFEDSAELLAGRVREYIDHLRRHIEKEETKLWPIAARVLTKEDDAEIAAGYDDVEQNHIGLARYKRYLEWTRQWAA